MNKKIHVGVLFGGVSGEHEVSLMSARSILSFLSGEKYEITQIGITNDGKWVSGDNVLEKLETGDLSGLTRVFLLPEPGKGHIYAMNGRGMDLIADLDVLFPILHGTFGEDGNLKGLFEITKIAYVGADVSASAVCMDKGLFKDLMRAYNIRISDWLVVSRTRIESQIDQVMNQAEISLSYPMFVKPSKLGSSVGVTKCRGRSDLLEGLLDAAKYDQRIIIEHAIDAREIEVSVLGNGDDIQASVPGEVTYSDDFYTYNAKYFDERTQLIIPAPISPEKAAEIQDLAVRVFKIVGGSGMARVDFLVDKDSGRVYMNELNTIPGFTNVSLFPKLWEHSGLPYADLVDRLITLVLERKAELDKNLYIRDD
ncbi:MAG: D-alanine--D-alanine ligase [Anaerolineaceae bacterium]|nr:D-alanine--D-alanine ligase [Anaerolineaceae bacterium]